MTLYKKMLAFIFVLAMTFPGALVVAEPESGMESRAPQTGAAPATAAAPPGGDFSLVSADGPVSLRDFRGKIVLLFFGYTSCPDVCPVDLGILAQALNRLEPNEVESVQGLFISLDPARDTPAILKSYTNHFHSRILGLTGAQEQVGNVARLYGVKYNQVELENSGLDYVINHSAAIYLISPDGRLRFIFPHATPAKMLVEAVRYVLSEN